jgi:transcriptional regulator with XRE-family HTH domain
LGERLARHRTTLGLSRQETARRIGIDPSTPAKREHGERGPAGGYSGRVERFLREEEAADLETRRAG